MSQVTESSRNKKLFAHKIKIMNKNQKLKVPAKGWSVSGGKGKILRKRGFSLVEVLFTLMVLSVGIAAVAALMTANIKNSTNAKNQIVASNLAQEGVELVRNLKDNKEINLDSLPAGTYDNQRIDKTMTAINSGADKRLYLNGGFYTHTATGTPTKFYRSVSLLITGDKAAIPSSTRITTVTSFVSWNATGSFSPCNVANQCVSVVSVIPDFK